MALLLQASCLAGNFANTDDTPGQAAAAAAAAANSTGNAQFPSNPNLPPFEPISPAEAANKVKKILVNLPMTGQEYQTVGNDMTALTSMLDAWMATDSYKNTMLRFLADAFQQSQMDAKGGDGLAQNMRESFARTAWQMISAGRSFRDIFTTKTYMMTTGLMYAYARNDTQFNDDNGAAHNQWYEDDPNWHFIIEKSRGSIDLADASDPSSPNYMTFYAPELGTGYFTYSNPQTAADQQVIDACAKLDPLTFYDGNIFARISGGASWVDTLLNGGGFRYFYPKEYQPNTILCTSNQTGPSYFQPSDYNDWRMVTIVPASKSMPQTKFINLPTFRSGLTTLNLYTEHAGYLTTPSFMAQWATNKSNSFRATVNQALIVGLGGGVGDDRLTKLPIQPATDPNHSVDPACMNCHQDLDPLRQFYRQSYSLFNGRQNNPNQINLPAKFAYGGVVADGTGVTGLAEIIANHPLMPVAWVMKVCTWATGAPCLESDPEVQQIAANFAKSMNFNEMVKEVMLSPIITYQSRTLTVATVGETSNLVRRDQLCSLLAQVTGMGEICGRDQVQTGSGYNIASLAQVLPGDQYGRGVNSPLYVTTSDPILRSTLENFCGLVAAKLAANPPNLPMATQDSNVAVPAMVHDLMGVPPGDDAAPMSILQQHWDAAMKDQKSQSAAWQSTFTLACLSPWVTSSGS